jgi:Flp pilus assembly protein TadB
VFPPSSIHFFFLFLNIIFFIRYGVQLILYFIYHFLIYSSIYPFMYLFIYLFICLFVYFVCLFVYPESNNFEIFYFQRSKTAKSVSETSDPPLESLLDMRIFDKYDSQKERKVSKKAGILYSVCVCFIVLYTVCVCHSVLWCVVYCVCVLQCIVVCCILCVCVTVYCGV